GVATEDDALFTACQIAYRDLDVRAVALVRGVSEEATVARQRPRTEVILYALADDDIANRAFRRHAIQLMVLVAPTVGREDRGAGRLDHERTRGALSEIRESTLSEPQILLAGLVGNAEQRAPTWCECDRLPVAESRERPRLHERGPGADEVVKRDVRHALGRDGFGEEVMRL